MGRMKWYVESENISPQQDNRTGASAHRKRRAATPGKLVREPLEAVPLNMLLRQIYLRLRRNWIAFQFQFNRYTRGVFRQRTLLKLGILGVAAYGLLFSGQDRWMAPGRLLDNGSAVPVETALEVGNHKSGSWLGKESAKPDGAIRWKGKNDAAPLSVGDLRDEPSEQYIARFEKIAIQEMHKYGIPASICMAQGLVESRFGTSKLAVNNNNHFGIKCFSKRCKKGHCSNFTDDHHKDFFRIYANAWESWRAHSQMLANSRYGRLKKYGLDYRKWAYGLEQLGYATDQSYAEKLIGVVEKFNLQRLDRQ